MHSRLLSKPAGGYRGVKIPWAPRLARSGPRAGLATLMLVALVVAAALLPGLVAQAASGTLYMARATDPHGELWLHGTLDGTTAGPMSSTPTDGRLWTADVAAGFCRVDLQPDGTFALASAVPGGCITAGNKASQPTLDARRNPDGTFYIYTCNWAVGSVGCYRLTYDPGAQVMR